MKRQLADLDVDSLNGDEVRFILSEQIESFRRKQEQAQRHIRITLLVLSIALGGISYQYAIQPSIFNMDVFLSTLLSQEYSDNDFFYLTRGLIIHIQYLLVLGVIFLFHSVVDAFLVIFDDEAIPLSHKKQRSERGIFNNTSDLREWIVENDHRLKGTKRRLQRSYFHIYCAVLVTIFSLLIWVGVSIPSVNVLVFLNAAIILSVPAFLYLKLEQSLRALVSHPQKPSFAKTALEEFDRIVDVFLHQGMGIVMKIICLIIYLQLVQRSLSFVTEYLF